MKIKSFKIKEIDGEVVKIMTDRQAGELFKAICSYNFNNEVYKGRDPLVKSFFALMKDSFDKDNFFRETGKLGGEKRANMRRENEQFGPCVARAVIGGDVVNEVMQTLFGDLEKPQKPCKVGDVKNTTNFAKK